MAQVLPNGSLLLPAVGIQDEGTFQCRAMSRKGKETKSDYQVRVYRKRSRAFPKAHLSFKEKPVTPALAASAPVCRPDVGCPVPKPVRAFQVPESDWNLPSFRDSWEARNC